MIRIGFNDGTGGVTPEELALKMSISVYDTDADGIVDKSEKTTIIVRNSTGATISKGKIVYLSGATGSRPNALLAKADSEATSSKTIGWVIADIANNSDGEVGVMGTAHDLDTSAYSAGDMLWLSETTAGSMTTTAPSEPNHSVFIGYVARSHPTAGRIVFNIQNGFELGELHGVDTDATKTTPIDADSVLLLDSVTSIWKRLTWSNLKSTIFSGFKTINLNSIVGSGDLNVSTRYGSQTTGAINSLTGMVVGDTVWNSTRGRTETYNGTYWAGERQDVYLQHGSVTLIASQTIAFGVLPVAPISAAIAGNPYRWICRGAKVIRGAEFNCYAGGTAGSNQAWSLYIRVNGTTDYLVATVSSTGPERIFSNQSLNISLVDGDHVRMVFVNPAWVTPPTGVATGGYLKIE